MKIKDQEAAEKYIKLCILLNIWSEYHAVTVQVQRRHINEKKQNFFLYYLAVSRTNKKDIIEKIWLRCTMVYKKNYRRNTSAAIYGKNFKQNHSCFIEKT